MPKSGHPLRVFLCHASADKPEVRELYRRLAGDGVEAWLDTENLLPGQNWQVEIPNAVRTSDVVLVCVSNNSINKEGYVQKEISFALDKALEMPEGRIFLIPARLEDCRMPNRLSNYQWVDLFNEHGYDRLMKALKVRAEQIGAEIPGGKRRAPLPWPKQNEPVSKPNRVEGRALKDPPSTSTVPSVDQRRGFPAGLIAVGIGLAVILVVAGYFVLPMLTSVFNPSIAPSVTETQPGEVVQESSPTISAETQVVTAVETATSLPQATATDLPAEQQDAAGVSMVLVPASDFTMGSANYCQTGSPEFCRGEKPPHQVYLDSYYMDKYEVSNAAYKTCVDAGICSRPTNSSRFNNAVYELHPVVYVDWNMAVAYCEWRGARLPTEAEWEKAARGIDERTYPWGEDIGCDRANYSGCVRDTAPVTSYPSGASPYGAYNMAGNVWEWVSDWYDENYYEVSPSSNPTGPQGGDYHVLRGGKWNHFDGNLRTVVRFRNVTTYANEYTGFRCVTGVTP
jgi:formylglycine-generating enzyme required for sulfatase activity